LLTISSSLSPSAWWRTRTKNNESAKIRKRKGNDSEPNHHKLTAPRLPLQKSNKDSAHSTVRTAHAVQDVEPVGAEEADLQLSVRRHAQPVARPAEVAV
jgi:hypothetical protein